ncbi:ATP-binding protein [Yinghuangia soli]|uniref:ATP-binding protein n=1 Tax=Yinghuangia soli TaxID=2908204 RepID=A0AA41U3Q5_9ACTN|nr:ATP-binding protein [Yinghuangia soli]MCF2532066.1 ATP-binding protein [Yinghuangia soli]
MKPAPTQPHTDPVGELAYAVLLDGVPSSARLARRLAVAQLGLWDVDVPPLVESVAMVTAELAANTVTHGSDSQPWQFRLDMVLLPDRLRVAVIEPDRGCPLPSLPQLPRPESTSGRGLFLVAAYSDRWGVDSDVDAGFRAVWAEFVLSGAAARGSGRGGPRPAARQGRNPGSRQ